jgi:hypothetical protein
LWSGYGWVGSATAGGASGGVLGLQVGAPEPTKPLGAIHARSPEGHPFDTRSRSDQVRAPLQAGVAPAQIAEQVGCSSNLVYPTRSAAARADEPTRLPAPHRTPPAGIDAIIAAVRRSQEQTDALRDGLLRIRAIVDELLG